MNLLIIKKFISILIDFFIPKICYGCSTTGYYLCPQCFKKLKLSLIHKCHVCGKETRKGFVHIECSELTYLDGVFNVVLYEGIIKELITDIKYNYYFAILDDLAKIMSEYIKFYRFSENTVLTSVPLHSYKKRLRGFNQAEKLAGKISKDTNYKYIELIKRITKTKTQVGLSKHEREINLKNAFEFIPTKNIISNVIIVDDVYTTGTTLNECAKVLKESGIEKVYGFTFARSRE